MPRHNDTRIIFITGTDTGVGKTVLTSLLVSHLRQSGKRALAIKPFCSGTRADAQLLCAVQGGELSIEQLNPYYFHEPVAPLVAVRKMRRKISLPEVLGHIRGVAFALATTAARGGAEPILLIEGSGGLLVPLGKNYSVLDLISNLDCEVIVAARNRLGTINHTLLTVRVLEDVLLKRRSSRQSLRLKRQSIRVAMMNTSAQTDVSCATNFRLLSGLLAPVLVREVPYLGAKCGEVRSIKLKAARIRKNLAGLV